MATTPIRRVRTTSHRRRPPEQELVSAAELSAARAPRASGLLERADRLIRQLDALAY
jgi:hypothetical protein